MISNKLKLIFPRIGKNASSSIIDFFKKIDPNLTDEGHAMIIAGIKNYLSNLSVDNYFSFAVVRNPFDRLVSAWFEYKKPNRFLNMKEDKALSDFSEFIDFTQKNNHIHWKSQYDILYENNNCIVDKVIYFENIETELNSICKILNIDFSKYIFPKINISNKNHYSTYYNDYTKDLVGKIYSKDLQQFNYDF